MLSNSSYLNTKIDFLKGVGEVRAQFLKEELGIKTYMDLLNHFPFRYVDRTQFQQIRQVKDGDTVQLKGTIVDIEKARRSDGRRRDGQHGVGKRISGFHL